MSKIKVELTIAQIDALLTAAHAMAAGEEGEGDFQCRSAVLERAIEELSRAKGRVRVKGRVSDG